MKIGTLRKLCSVLSVSADHIINGTECPHCSEEVNSILAPLSDAKRLKAVKLLSAISKIQQEE